MFKYLVAVVFNQRYLLFHIQLVLKILLPILPKQSVATTFVVVICSGLQNSVLPQVTTCIMTTKVAIINAENIDLWRYIHVFFFCFFFFCCFFLVY